MRISRLSAAAAIGVALGLMPGPAAGSCVMLQPFEDHLAQAEVVFVGMVTALTDEDRTAAVQVEEIWTGQEIPARVTVYGSTTPDDANTVTSVDRFYEANTRYLFAVNVDQGRFVDNACSATSEWTAELGRLRPASASAPGVTSDAGGELPVAALAVALAVLAVGTGSVLAFRSRS
jgi:hypothetical protein